MQNTVLDANYSPPSPPSPPVVSRRGVVLLMIWCAIEATFFAFAMRPTISELISDLAGFTVNPIVLVVPLGIFLTIIIAGSFACIQVLKDAIAAKKIGDIVSMTLVQVVVALMQVLFLYRGLVDAMTPWLAQQGMVLGPVATLSLASMAWIGVRGMTWYLLGRAGARALIPLLGAKPRANR